MENSWLCDFWTSYTGSIALNTIQEKEEFLNKLPLTFLDKLQCSKFRINCHSYDNKTWASLTMENYLSEVKEIISCKGVVRIDFPFNYKGDVEHYLSIFFDDTCSFQIDFHGSDEAWQSKRNIEKIEWIEKTFCLKVISIEGYPVKWVIEQDSAGAGSSLLPNSDIK